MNLARFGRVVVCLRYLSYGRNKFPRFVWKPRWKRTMKPALLQMRFGVQRFHRCMRWLMRRLRDETPKHLVIALHSPAFSIKIYLRHWQKWKFLYSEDKGVTTNWVCERFFWFWLFITDNPRYPLKFMNNAGERHVRRIRPFFHFLSAIHNPNPYRLDPGNLPPIKTKYEG